MSYQDDVNTINEALKAVGDQYGEMRANLQNVEQKVAMIEQGGSGYLSSYRAGPGIGQRAMDELRNDVGFQSALNAAERGMKQSQFAAAVEVVGGLRAALTNDNATSSNGDSIPSNPEHRGFVGPAQRPLRLLDVLPVRSVSRDSVEFVRISATGDAAEQEQEGDEKAEIDFDGTQARAEIVTIAGWTAASKQVLADHVGLQQQIDRVIRYKVLARLEHQLINGNGAPGRIEGLIELATDYTPTIATENADVVGEALTAMADGGYTPSLVIVNPFDWFDLQIQKDGEERYLFGSPTSPLVPSLWNTPIVRTSSLGPGQALVLDTSFTTVLDREQMNVTVSNSHADFFTRNLIAILGELRAGLEVLDTGAVRRVVLTPSSGP